MDTIKKTERTNVAKVVEKLEPLCIARENVKWGSCCGKGWFLKKLNIELSYTSSIPLLVDTQNKAKTWIDICILIFIAALFTVGETRVFSSGWMDKQNVVSTYNGILFSFKMEVRSDTCFSMDEPWRHYVKLNQLVTKGRVLYASIYVKYPL